MLSIFSKKDIAEMVRHSEEGYPLEVAGAITGDGRDASGNRQVKFTNIQELKHREDPGRYSQDARTGYFADPKEVFEFHRKVKAEGLKILALYHSHPDHESYFSQTDHDAAVMWGEPTYPGTLYIVISVKNGKAEEAIAFAWNGKSYANTQKLTISK